MSASNEKNNRYLLTDWKPENPAFWENKGKHIARRNLCISVSCLLLAFCVWMLFSADVYKRQAFFCPGCCIAQRPAVVLVLARRTDGLCWLTTVLAGNTSDIEIRPGFWHRDRTRLHSGQLTDNNCTFRLCIMFLFV